MIRIYVEQGRDEGRVIESSAAKITIGRSETAIVYLSDAHLSSEHGLIFRDVEGYIYRDLRSTNGSMLVRETKRIVLDGNDRWEAPISSGDRLLLGDATSPVILHFSIADGSEVIDSRRIIATRRVEDLTDVMGKVQDSPDISAIYQATRAFTGQLDLDQVLTKIARATMQLVPQATHVTIALAEDDTEQVFVPMLGHTREGATTEPPTISRAVQQRIITDRAAVLAADAADELGSKSIVGAKIRSTLGVPLWHGDRILGVVQVDNRDSSGIFSERELDVLLVMAEQGALAIKNARLYSQLTIAQEKIRGENRYLRGQQRKIGFDHIISEAPAMKRIFKLLDRVIDTRATVCISGETGTGKELIARAIHDQGQRRDKLFVAQNCAALPENLLESELFGHLRGAFTGADSGKKGLFEIADAGTLFLDEVGEIPLALQAKLLRALQEGEIRPLGASKAKRVDVRIVCATNRSLEKEVAEGRFREDLFYRLMVFPIELPPLRERREDIPLLMQHFVKRYSQELRRAIAGISQDAINHLVSYRWPGNIRELENEIQRLMIQVDEDAIVQVEHLSPSIRRTENIVSRVAPQKGTLKEMMEGVERWLLTEALKEHGNNKTKTAATLGITREGLHKKLTKHGI